MVDPQVGMVTLFGNRSGSRPVADLVSTQMAAESLGCDKICWGGNCHNGLLSMSVVAGVVVCFCGCGHDWFFVVLFVEWEFLSKLIQIGGLSTFW